MTVQLASEGGVIQRWGHSVVGSFSGVVRSVGVGVILWVIVARACIFTRNATAAHRAICMEASK